MSDEDKPDWWKKNEAYKRRLGIPEYRPPRFEDAVYTHTVVDRLESKYDCTIRFVGHDTRYQDEWDVQIDGTPVMTIDRHRDTNGNTVYEMSARDFERAIEDELSDDAR